MIVRKPHPQELESTLILLEYQRDEEEIEEFDTDYVAQEVKTHITKATHCWFNAYEGTRPVGCIGGYVTQSNYSKDRVALINFFYVLKSHRDRGIYGDLLKSFTEWANSIECKKIMGGDLTVNYDQLYESLGFSSRKLWIKD